MAELPARQGLMKRLHPESIPWPGSVLYNLISSTAIFQRHYELVADDILSFWREGSFLDIGTGPGRLLLKLHHRAPQLRLVGIDSSPAMVTKARQNMADAALSNVIEIKQGNADNIPFPDDYFNIVVSTASIHHWKQPAVGLNEAYRVLKKEGFALIYDLVSDTPQSILDDCRRKFGKLKTTLFWLHSFEEPFYNQHNFQALARSTLFGNCQSKFLGLLYCLILKK
jgi:ubiquinone/menaquinone biosynthesis C-methylase UbiE